MTSIRRSTSLILRIALALAASFALPGLAAAQTPRVLVTEVHPSGSGNGTYGSDWFELTNAGTVPVTITGWKVDDSSNAFGSALTLRGVTTIPAGGSAIFIEGDTTGSNDAAKAEAFSTAWFGSPTPPAGVQIGGYGGSGIGLGTGGDAVNIFDASGAAVTGVSFGAAPVGAPVATVDNSTGAAIVTIASVDGTNGAFISANLAEVGSPGRRVLAKPLTAIDLSTYVRTGRFALPTGVAPPGNSLALEASAVTYNWDTDTLFIVGDEGTAIVQVSKTGQLIDSMPMAAGQFVDPEGLAYVGGGNFVIVEERERQVVLFRYDPSVVTTRAMTRTVDLGTTVGNIGLEGVSFDPLTGGFILVKEIDPQAIFQANIDFDALTASNGSATTANSINLFDPALASQLDFADVFSLSNLPGLTGPEAAHILVLSQEEGTIINVSRSGVIASTLVIADPGSPVSVPAQGHEGLAMDGNGVLYIVNEGGGGSNASPQLWIYEPSLVPNQPPSAIVLGNVTTTLAENTTTSARLRVAEVTVTDDGLGANVLGVTGADAAFFEVDNSGLYIKAGTVLDFETKTTYNVTVTVDDVSVGATPDAIVNYTLTLTDVVIEVPPVAALIVVTEVAPWPSGNSPYAADWFELTNTGAVPVDITGWRFDDDSNTFASGVVLNGISSIAPGESVIFMETADIAATRSAFLQTWFGVNAPAGLQVGGYSGSGAGLSTGGDAVNIFDASGNRVTGIRVAASTTGFSFDNAAGAGSTTLPLPLVTMLSVNGVNGVFVAANASETGSPGRVAGPPPPPQVIISEISPWSSSGTAYGADWFEITNVGSSPVDITGWKMDDSSDSAVSAVALNGVTTIAPGESVIFLESASPTTTRSNFLTAWFGTNQPAGLQVGTYTGSGVGLSTGGDGVSLFDAAGNRIKGVLFGSSGPVVTFDNAAGAGSATTPLPTVSTLSSVGVNGAFVAVDAHGTGSPGTITSPPAPLAQLVITEVTPWGNNNGSYNVDWFELTNVGTTPVDLTGFKMDDESASFATGALLTGVNSIAPGESVIFLETATLATARDAFLAAWFGGNPPAGLQVGGYSASGVGLGNGGDAVNIFDATARRVTGVAFVAATAGFTFDNAAGLGATTAPLPTLTTLSVAGINGALSAVSVSEVGSPGRIADTTPPVIAPSTNIVVEAAGPAGAAVNYALPVTTDDTDAAGVASCAPAPGVFGLGTTTVTCTATDIAGNAAAPETFTVRVQDTTAPVVTVPANIAATTIVAGGATVTFVASALDAVDGARPVSCSPSSGAMFPIGATTVTCTSTDTRGNSASAGFTVTVTLVQTPDGRMFGTGHVDAPRKHHHFEFRVSEVGTRDFARFEYWVRGSSNRFEATSVTSVLFSNDPAFRPGRGRGKPEVDSVVFSGTGRWNGKSGYTFTVTATDEGEPGRRRDSFTMVIKDKDGRTVASVEGELSGGNIQSTRLGHPFWSWF